MTIVRRIRENGDYPLLRKHVEQLDARHAAQLLSLAHRRIMNRKNNQ
jgi:hypothetical protein